MIDMEQFILKGNIIFSKEVCKLEIIPHGYLVCIDGMSQGAYKELPVKYKDIPIIDYEDKLILPGFVDLHTHASQYAFRGMGMDYQLLDWLEKYTFPEEAKFNNLDYAFNAYKKFAKDLKNSCTTRACIWATIHEDTTLMLMSILKQTGLKCMVGKVCMDRNSPDYLTEHSAVESAERTRSWISKTVSKFGDITPIVTPRFIPSCSDELMKQLSLIQKEFQLPVQSHISENKAEIEWVKTLCPDAEDYADAYDQFGLFGRDCKTVMAHCVYPTEKEITRIKNNNVFIAICAESNMNLSSGVPPISRLIDAGVKLGLGTDIAAGSSLSMFQAMVNTIKASKLYNTLVDHETPPIGMEEAMYFATKGGGAFFGNVGSFEKGYEFDAVIIDDGTIKNKNAINVRDRLERVIYLADEHYIEAKYVGGIKVLERTKIHER